MLRLIAASAPATPISAVRADARGPIIAGLVVVLGFFGGFGGWAALAPLAGAVVADGVVKVEANRQAVQHLEGGLVKQILVEDGARVEAGDVLIRLDETAARAAVDMLAAQSDALRGLEARLVAERDGSDRIGFPDDLVARQHESQIAALLAGQLSLFDARRRAFEGQRLLQVQKIAQSEAQIDGYASQLRSQQRQMALVEEEARGTRELYEKGFAPKTKVLALDRTTASLDGQRGELVADIARSNQQIGETRLQILQLAKDRLSEIADQLRDTQTKLLEVAPRLAAARDTLDHTELKAPRAGYVVGLTAFTVGGVIAKGEHVLDVVPVASPLVIEGQVKPEDIEGLRPGARAEVRLTAYKQRTVPTVRGTVSKLSADRLTDPRTGAGYYLIQVALDPDALAALPAVRLSPGMPAEIMVPTRDRTALDYLLAPLTAGFDRALREK
jgi:HlyD family type I secretion membrane fusion protein